MQTLTKTDPIECVCGCKATTVENDIPKCDFCRDHLPMTIQTGQTLYARSAGDHDCIFEAEVIERKGGFATVMTQNGIKRVKVRVISGEECIFALGRYSMAPCFRPAKP